jgi:hypothetical protein
LAPASRQLRSESQAFWIYLPAFRNRLRDPGLLVGVGPGTGRAKFGNVQASTIRVPASTVVIDVFAPERAHVRFTRVSVLRIGR